MKIVFVDKKIEDQRLIDLTGISSFKDLLFNKKSLEQRACQTFKEGFEILFVNDIDEVNSNEKYIFWNSNVTFICKDIQRKFLKKLKLIYQDALYGDKNGYVFKGSASTLNSIFKNTTEPHDGDYLSLQNEKNLRVVLNFMDYRNLILHLPESRFFNSLEVKDSWIKKTSFNKSKILNEYNQLQNIPDTLRKYFVQTKNYYENNHHASYEVEKINGIDLSVLLLSNQISEELLNKIFNKLSEYLLLTQNITDEMPEQSFSFIIKKNYQRLEQLYEWKDINLVNSFIKKNTEFDGLKDIFKKLNQLIVEKDEAFEIKGLIYSHGDLCFSNILLEEDSDDIKLIDPRGSKDGRVYLSPYYDLAKLSHSILGGYDHIINGQTEILYNKEMKARVSFKNELPDYESTFIKFIENLGYDYRLVRLIEISLFSSMLPLHTEDLKKVTMLSLRAGELLNQYINK